MNQSVAPAIPGRTTEDQHEFRAIEAGRLIGIDAGTKTLGLALSDVRRTIASPLETIRRTKFTADAVRLFALIAEHGVAGLVLGLPAIWTGRRVRAHRRRGRLLAISIKCRRCPYCSGTNG